jgi:phenylpropionate dioxygenase-like ring-hydroxylating dioxygenase large terminal subunit
MIEKELWHPVALAEEVADAPLAVRLLGDKLVLWRGAAGAVQAWADRCPHRGAQLSLGRVVPCEGGTALECPYHGWRFATGGQCAHVPALPEFVPPATHRTTVHAAQEAHGLVWVRLQGEGGALPVETSAPRLVENFLDMAHFGFVHEGWLGAREMTAIDDYRVEATPGGLLATGCRAWQPQSTINSTAPAKVEYSYEVTAPYAAVLTKIPEAASVGMAGYQESIALFICPVDAERSRVWFRLATADFARDDAQLRAFQDTIFLQDKPVLESQQPKRLPLDLRAELHTAADKASSFYRRHLLARGITFGVC